MTDREATEALALQRELLQLRKDNAQLALVREGLGILLGIVARYQRAIRSTGAVPCEEETVLVESIRKMADQ